MENSEEYEKAYDAHTQASKVYREVSLKYRNMEIDDDEFIKARRIFDQANKDFAEAFLKEQERQENKEEKHEEDPQQTFW